MIFKSINWRQKILVSAIPRFLLGLLFIYFYCEYIIYYVTQIQCGWPALSIKTKGDLEPVRAMVLADTHLLGSRNGHWFDRWRREWQMHRAFQTAMTIHQPELVFVLGDLFDEGKWCSQHEFNDYVQRFFKLFEVPEGTILYSVVGNHDIGFHYRTKRVHRLAAARSGLELLQDGERIGEGLSFSEAYARAVLRDTGAFRARFRSPSRGGFSGITPQLANRFEKQLNSPPVRLLSLRGNHFVLINSMAMEGDGCSLCSRAVTEIDKISDILKCSSGSPLCKSRTKLELYSRPIVMQHYPLYRESDSVCTEPDAAPLPQRRNLFEQRRDCVSRESTEYLVESLRPRAAFGAHTHHSCLVRHSFAPTRHHKVEFVEYTVPSFSWRNRLDPKYYLLTLSPDEVKVAKCGMPRERTMQVTAIAMLLALLIYAKYCGPRPTASNYKLSGKKV